MNDLITVAVAIVAVALAITVWLQRKALRRSHHARDLSEREERFHIITEHAPVMVWTTRPDTSLDYLNKVCMEFTGAPLAEVMDHGWMNFAHPDDVEPAKAIYLPAVAARQPLAFQYRLLRADGVYRWMHSVAVPSFDSDGELLGYIGNTYDIQERREAEYEVSKSRTALEENHREIQQLAGLLLTAHEDERRRIARELHDDLTQRLARAAIDISRIEGASGSDTELLGALRADIAALGDDTHALSYRMHPSILDDLGLVEALRSECDRVRQKSSLDIVLDAQDVPRALSADASLCLFRITQEAIGNALRHARARQITVGLRAERQGIELSVSDDGDGFDLSGPRDHASLGLASMRERVRILDGEFGIASQPGSGTRIVAWVPQEQPDPLTH